MYLNTPCSRIPVHSLNSLSDARSTSFKEALCRSYIDILHEMLEAMVLRLDLRI